MVGLVKAVAISFVLYLKIPILNAYFLNLGTFLQPILNPQLQTFGSVIQHNKKGKDSLNKQREQFSNKNIDLKQLRKKNIRKWNYDTAKDLYSVIGIPKDVIYTKILPVHLVARYDLNRYFENGSSTKQRLYASLKRLKLLIDWIVQVYLKNIDNVILGSNNQINGRNVYVKANHHKIEGRSNFVFNPHFNHKVVKGDNIVRISRFDVNLQKLENVITDPYQCVTLLSDN